jgi:addiction module RelE/StbE family toxin
MYSIVYKPSFIKQARKLSDKEYTKLKQRIDLLKDKKNHEFLKVHKLHGEFAHLYSLSITNRIRAIFYYEEAKVIAMVNIGDHSIYNPR